MFVGDPSSLSNLEYFSASHLEWQITVDFDEKRLDCVAKQTFQCIKDISDGNYVLVLDTMDIKVTEVKCDGTVVKHSKGDPTEYLGEALIIQIPQAKCLSSDKTFEIEIAYCTQPEAAAVQWLKAEQTKNGKYPFMFTQCQSIYARSLVPCQDSPGKKITYNANITVSKEFVALMSAIHDDEASKKQKNITHKTFYFRQEIPIPSYLIAIAVGDLESENIGNHPTITSKVWCEVTEKKEWVKKCQWEFEQVGKMIEAGVSLLGDYVWKQYDILVLPPSFPYGGMENPCLTFATPTIVAGDRSLVSVVAHEITHSWTGNLVTNINWEHFWLNEGFTRLVEGKIMEIIETNNFDPPNETKGKQYKEFMAIVGWNDLVDAVNTYESQGKGHFTKLIPDLQGENPEEAFSTVPYEKGYTFLFHMESLVKGKDASFNKFLKDYIETFKGKSLDTDDFKYSLLGYFLKHNFDDYEKLKNMDWDTYLYAEGLPPENQYDQTYAQQTRALANKWEKADTETAFDPDVYKGFIILQKIDFLTKLFQDGVNEPSNRLSLEMTKKLDETYQLKGEENAEIKFQFQRLAIRAKWDEVVNKEVIEFITTVGRMKFCQPLYREMHANGYEELAESTFLEHEDFYHPVAAAGIRRDLGLDSKKKK